MSDEPDEQADARDAFEPNAHYPQLQLEGTAAELLARLRSQAGARPTMRSYPLLSAASVVLALVGVLVPLVYLLVERDVMHVVMSLDIDFPSFAIWVVYMGFWLFIYARGLPVSRRERETSGQVDERKWGLLEPLLDYLAHELPADERVMLYVDFRSPFIRGQLPTHEARFDGLGPVLPDSEPRPHDWLRLQARFGDLELHMRVRTLVGTSGEVELRLRDEIGIELRGEGLASAIEAEPPSELRTSLLAHELTPARARLQFRGRGAARRELIYAPPTVADVFSKQDDTGPEYKYSDLEWLLAGRALVDHIEAARAIVRPRGASSN